MTDLIGEDNSEMQRKRAKEADEVTECDLSQKQEDTKACYSGAICYG